MIFDKAINNIRNETAMIQQMSLNSPDEWLKGITSGIGQSGAMKLSAVNACVEVLSNSISKLPSYITDRNTNERIISHPLNYVMQIRPNEAMTPAVYKKLMETYKLMNGNAYAIIIRDGNTGNPKELIPINPQYIEPRIRDGQVLYMFSNPKTGEISILDNSDVIHYKAYSEDGIKGISVLKRAQEVINTAKAAQVYENKMYTNNARPQGVLKSPQPLEKEAKDKVRDEWAKIHSGEDNAFRVAVLDVGLEYQQISLSNEDLQFAQNKEISVVDIARFYGVPLYKIFAGKQSYNSNEQNAIEYVTSTLQPMVTQYEEEDSYKLLFTKELMAGYRIKRNMMAELRGDNDSRGKWYNLMRLNGVYSPNDICALEDLPKVPGGDTRYASLNYVPLEHFVEISLERNRGDK